MLALKKIFSGSGVSGLLDQSSQPKSRKRGDFYKISQGSNYGVIVDISGDAPYSSCILSVNAVAGMDNKLPIAARFSWKRYYKGPEQDMNVSSNTFHLSPLDSGCFIKVYITPIEEDNIYREISTIVFGPIVLDPLIKRTLQGIMRAGGFKFQAERITLAESEDQGGEGLIMLSQNCLQIQQRKNPSNPVRIMLTDKFKIHSLRNQFKVFILEMIDDGKSGEIAKMFGIPKSRNFKKLKFILSSVNSKDLLILSINLFKSLQLIKDSEVFQMVTHYIKDAPPQTSQQRPSNPEEEEDEDDNADHNPQDESDPSWMQNNGKDAIDQLFLNNGLKDEIYRLYNSNKELAVERNKLQMKVVNLESELTRSVNVKGGYGSAPLVPEDSPHNSSNIANKQEEMSQLDINKMAMIKKKNMDISANIKNIEGQNNAMRAEIERLTKIFKQMRYKEMMESKLMNSTVNAQNNNRDISNLEQALDDYAKEYEKIMANMNPQGAQPGMLEGAESDRSLSLVDELEERALEVLMRNERLKDDIQKYKDIIIEMERGGNKGGENRNPRDSFLGNESFIRPSPPVRNEVKMEYEMKIENLDSRIKRITLENSDLTEQIKNLKIKLSEQTSNEEEARIFKKLKMQLSELRIILENKKKKNADLQKMKIALQDQQIDMRAATMKVSDSHQKKIADLKFKKEQLEKSSQLLEKEGADLQQKYQIMEQEYKSLINQSSPSLNQSSSQASRAQNIDKMRMNIKELEEKIAVLERAEIDRQNMLPKLSKAEMDSLRDAKKMNENLINEIVRLNEMIRKASKEKDKDTTLF